MLTVEHWCMFLWRLIYNSLILFVSLIFSCISLPQLPAIHTHILQRVVLVCSRRQWETNNVSLVPMARSLTLTGLVASVHLATLDLRVAVRATPFPKYRKKSLVILA